MQLTLARYALALGAILLLIVPAASQSLSPMKKDGLTPSDIKGFKLTAGNPYEERMTFVAVPMDPSFSNEVGGAVVKPSEFRLDPGASRPLRLQFKIDTPNQERTVAVCIYPKDLAGPLLPRVCGTYTGRRVGKGG